MKNSSTLRAGDWVQVKSREEILATLDENGRLEGMPFMPEMLQFCGKRFRVFKRAHKTCDTVNKTGGRHLPHAVHLEELRCDGTSHGGCQAACLLFWKDAWLTIVPDPSNVSFQQSSMVAPTRALDQRLCDEAALLRSTRTPDSQHSDDPVYICQATLLPTFTSLLSRWDFRQYWEDLMSRNISVREMVGPAFFASYERVMNLGIGVGGLLRWTYDRVQKVFGGQPYPRHRGRIPAGSRTPSQELNLQPGEWVRVRQFEDILTTLDENNRNRGMYFDAEEVPFCGKTYRVKDRVSRIIDERTGRMLVFKSESIILDGVYCQARYSCKRLFCPRAIYPLWREVWLERVQSPKTDNTIPKNS